MASLVDLLHGLGAGKITSRSYVDRLLDRIRVRDGRIFAFSHLDFNRARALADACDRHRAGGGAVGPLHGLPIAVKDIFDTSDLRTEMGIAIYANRQPTRDAALVTRIRAMGGFVIGKTITSEAAYVKPAETRNPWNPQHSPGGSSSGSAAAVAAGFVHAAIGTQTSGSIMRPAAFCGVIGFKPSIGSVSMVGAMPFSRTLDQAGFFARTVADVSVFAAPLVDNELFPRQVSMPVRPPRLGLILDYPWTALEPESRQKVSQVVRVLAAAGASVTMLALPARFDDSIAIHRSIMLHEAARQFQSVQDEARARLSPVLNDGLDEGRRISKSSYGEAMSRRARLVASTGELFEGIDAIISPPAQGPAPAGLDTAGDPGFCTLWTLLGLPAIVVPCTVAANGLPLGLQVIGPAACDGALLSCASWIEAAVVAAGRRSPAPPGVTPRSGDTTL